MLQIRERVDHHTTILTHTGKFHLESITGVKALILRAKEMGCQDVILDFSALTGMDAEGLRQLFLWYDRMQLQGIKISIVNPSFHIQEALTQAHISEIVPIFASQEEAIRYHEAS